MSMSVVSDSVETEKDFPPPTKKLKREEHNTDSVTSLSDRQIFDIWCKFFRVTYKDEKEESHRFGIFQKAIKLDKTEDGLRPNYRVLADRSEQELKGCCMNPYISKSYLEHMMQYVGDLADHSEDEDESDDDCNAPDVNKGT